MAAEQPDRPPEADARDATRDDAGGDTPRQMDLPHVDTTTTAAAGEHKAAPPHDDDTYRVKLDVFDGPLDLLLHLIRKHELDILDIPVGFITAKYLEYLDLMKGLHIDVASEYLVMAATLAHIKSKMLLPPDPSAVDDEDADGEPLDPRADLVRRLLEYQKYKHAAFGLGGRAQLGRDLFGRGTSEPAPADDAPLAPVNVFRLFDAFEQVLKRAKQTADHQVLFERISLADRIVELTELLHERRRVKFTALFERGDALLAKDDIVVTFLALLEMCKMRVARVIQDDPLGEIEIELATKRIDAPPREPPAAEPERAAEAARPEAFEAGPDGDRPAIEGDDGED